MAAFLALLALWLLHRSYAGIIHDSRIYMGAALAEMDPAGVGQDLMFVLDEQSKFSLMRPVVTAAAEALGLEHAALVLTLIGIIGWFLGAWVLVAELAAGRTRWAALVCIIVLPARYATVELFSYGQAFMTPRLYAEAAALAGLAYFLRGRPLISAGWLIAAVGLHPLMGLPALAIVLVALSIRDRRWLITAGLGVLAVVGAGLVDLPVAGRLFTALDAEWLEQIRIRNQYIFPRLWEQRAFGQLAVHAATVLLAANLAPRRVGEFLNSAALVAVGGVVASILFGDLLANLLVAQLQPWRSLWLLALLANAAIAMAAIRLWAEGPPGKLIVAVLATAWVLSDLALFSIPLLAGAIGLYRLHRKQLLRPGKKILGSAWAALGVVAAGFLALRIGLMVRLLLSANQIGARVSVNVVLLNSMLGLLIAALGIAWAVSSRFEPRWPSPALVTLGAVLTITTLLVWDERTPYQQMLEDAVSHYPVASLIEEPDRSVPIVWVEGKDEQWYLAGRPGWGKPLQAAGGVFSRDLALEAENRLATLIDLGLTSPNARDTFQTLFPEPATPTARSIRAACEQLDPPIAAVVVPGAAPQDLPGIRWVPEHPQFVLRTGGSDPWSWERIDEFSVFNCD